MKKAQHTISSASSGSCDKVDKASGGNKRSPEWDTITGEPTACTIYGTDISVLYQDTDCLEEDYFQQLPNITKEWFRNNSNVPYPDHFKKF